MVRSLVQSQSLSTVSFTLLSCFVLATMSCGPGARPSDLGKDSAALVKTTSILGTAQAFAVLAGTTVTNTGSSIVNDNVGVSPGSEVTGFPPGRLTDGEIHAADGKAEKAQDDLTAAYIELAKRRCEFDFTGQELAGKTLKAGVYCFTSEAQLNGTLVLDAENRADALFIFQMVSKLTTSSGASVRLINNASPCNVFWKVGSSAALGTQTAFVGNIVALTSISLATGASLQGRALARNGAVTLQANNITDSTCKDTTAEACCDDTSLCGGACIKLSNDSNHCGACGNRCAASQVCSAGACIACPSDRTQCKDQCADLTSDPFNCGACGNTCAGSETCVAGACSACTATVCTNICVETHTDRNNCGACGNVCDEGQCCHQGACTKGREGETMCQHQ